MAVFAISCCICGGENIAYPTSFTQYMGVHADKCQLVLVHGITYRTVHAKYRVDAKVLANFFSVQCFQTIETKYH